MSVKLKKRSNQKMDLSKNLVSKDFQVSHSLHITVRHLESSKKRRDKLKNG